MGRELPLVLPDRRGRHSFLLPPGKDLIVSCLELWWQLSSGLQIRHYLMKNFLPGHHDPYNLESQSLWHKNSIFLSETYHQMLSLRLLALEISFCILFPKWVEGPISTSVQPKWSPHTSDLDRSCVRGMSLLCLPATRLMLIIKLSLS